MRAVQPLLILVCLALSGCYESQALLLDASAPRQPFGAGERTLVAEDGTSETMRLSPRKDGWYDVQLSENGDDWDDYRVLLNDLSAKDGHRIYAYATYDTSEGAYIYGVIDAGPHGEVRKKDADCHREADADFATRIGGASKLTDSCQFTKDTGLIASLRALADNPKHWTLVGAR